MTTTYLDWNVFNKLEKISELTGADASVYYSFLQILREKKIVTPYSNAHISDLYRGYLKNPTYTEGHLSFITELTNNLCLTQYWGETKARWHYRNPKEFLESTTEEIDYTSSSFSSLFTSLNEPLLDAAFSLQKSLLRMQPVDPKFKQIYAADPIFQTLYPRTRTEMNLLALCEDLYDFSFKIKSDYTLYKNFRKYLIQMQVKFPQYQKLNAQFINKVIGKPQYLTWDEMWDSANEIHAKNHKTDYDRIVNLFTLTDFKGYRQDERFANLIDDALHSFYAGHCHYFITIDKRCYDKAVKVYETAKINTKVMTPEEFIATANQI